MPEPEDDPWCQNMKTSTRLHIERFAQDQLGRHVNIRDTFQKSVWYNIHKAADARKTRSSAEQTPLPNETPRPLRTSLSRASPGLPSTSPSRRPSTDLPNPLATHLVNTPARPTPLFDLSTELIRDIIDRLPPANVVALGRTCKQLHRLTYDVSELKLESRGTFMLSWQLDVLRLMDTQCREATVLLDRDRSSGSCGSCLKVHSSELYDPVLLQQGVLVCVAAQSTLPVCPHWIMSFGELRKVRNDLIGRGEFSLWKDCPCSPADIAPYLAVPCGNLIAVREFNLVASPDPKEDEIVQSLHLKSRSASHPAVCSHLEIDCRAVVESLKLSLPSQEDLGSVGGGACAQCSAEWTFFVERSLTVGLLQVTLHVKRVLGRMRDPWSDEYLRHTRDSTSLLALRDAVEDDEATRREEEVIS